MLGDFDAMEGRIKTEQDRKYTYYVPLRRVRVIIFFRGNQYYIICACVYIFALVIQHANHVFTAPYYIFICGLSGSTIFLHIIS